MPRRVDHGQRADHREAGDVGHQHQRPPVVAVGERATNQHRRQDADSLERQHEAERARRSRQRERAPAERHHERGVTQERDRLAGPEQAEVAALKGLEHAGARRNGGAGLHRPKAILRP